MKFLLLLIVRIDILISNKGSEKGSDSVDFCCNTLKFENSRIALNQSFLFPLKRNDPLFHFCKHNVFAKFW